MIPQTLLLSLLLLLTSAANVTFWELKDKLRPRAHQVLVCFYGDYQEEDHKDFLFYARKVGKQYPEVEIVSLQITAANIERLVSTFEVDNFQVTLFSGGYTLPFDMNRGLYHLPAFVTNRRQVVNEIQNLTQFMQIRESLSPETGLMAVLFLSGQQTLLSDYVQSTNRFREAFGCYVVTDPTLTAALKGKDKLVLFRNFDTPKVTLSSPSPANMPHFLLHHQYPSLVPVTLSNHEYLMRETELPVLVMVLLNPSDTVSEQFVYMLGKVRKALSRPFQFTYYFNYQTTIKVFYQNYLNHHMPIGTVFVYNPNPNEDFPDRYYYEGTELTEASLLTFLRKYLQNEVPRYRKSQSLPSTEQNHVQVLNTYSTDLLVSSRTILLMRYWSADLVEDLETRFDYFCQHHQHPDIDYARLDLSKNEYAEEGFRGKVTLNSYSEGHLSQSVVVHDAFRFDDLVMESMRHARETIQPHKEDL